MEYLQTVTVETGATVNFPIPAAGIAGVHSDSSLILKWNFNGVTAELHNGTDWEPLNGFHPAPTSILVLDNSAGLAAVNVTVRCYEKG